MRHSTGPEARRPHLQPAPRRSLLHAATRPVPLALLVAGGIAGAAITWPLAGIGALAYVVAVAVGVGATRRTRVELIPPPEASAVRVRSTEVMAHVVRIRKGHAAVYDALIKASPTIQALMSESYARLGEYVGHAYQLAQKADGLRAHLDSSKPAAALERELATLPGNATAQVESLRDQLAARKELEREFVDATTQLGAVAASLEGWRARILSMSAQDEDEVKAGSKELTNELANAIVVVRGLEETLKI